MNGKIIRMHYLRRRERELRKLVLCDGKYTVVNELENGGGFYALRHGEKWRSLAGDNLVLAMFQEIEELVELKEAYESALREIENGTFDIRERLVKVAKQVLDKHNPHRSCPNCHDDCVGWIVDGTPCTGGAK